MKLRFLAGAMALAFAISPLTAFAGDSGQATVTIPWGDWLGSLLTASATIVVSLIGLVVHRFLPPALSSLITDSVINKAVDYAIATTSGAIHGKEASIGVTNELIAVTANWIIANEPKIADWAGDNLRPLIVARLAAVGVVPAGASASTLRLQPQAGGTGS